MSQTYELPGKTFSINVPHPTLGVPVTIGTVCYKEERTYLINDDIFIIFDFITKYQDVLYYSVLCLDEEKGYGLPQGDYLLIQRDEEGNVLPINDKFSGYIKLPIIEKDRTTSFSIGWLVNGAIDFNYGNRRDGKLHPSLKYYVDNSTDHREDVEQESVSSIKENPNIVPSKFLFLDETYQGYFIDDEFYLPFNNFIVHNEEKLWDLMQSIDKSLLKYIAADRHGNFRVLTEAFEKVNETKISLVPWKEILDKLTFIKREKTK
jgi:hypothetical protein